MTRLLRPLTHPREQVLTRVASREGEVPQRVRDHLASCPACRGEVSALRALLDGARDLPTPAPHPELLAAIRSRIAAGDDVLLPVPAVSAAEATRQGRVRRTALLAAVAVVAAVALLWVSRPARELAAGDLSGELRLIADAAHPRALRIEYRAPATLGGEGALVLRARYRSAWGIAYAHEVRQVAAGRLERGRDGVFRGRLVLPDSVVFAVFAVEDSAASRVDHHHQALWEWMARRADGQPTFEALQQRENDMMGRNMELAFATARRRAALYPDDPNAWASVVFQEKINLGEVDSLLARHLERLAALHAKYAAQRDVPFEIVDGMLSYRVQVTDSSTEIGRAVRDHWRPIYRRLAAADTLEGVSGIEARWRTINERAMKGADSARAALPAAEALWTNGGRRWPWAARLGSQIARLAKDSGETRVRWADRYAAVSHDAAEYIYSSELGQVSALRPVAVARLRTVIAALGRPDDTRRPLELTRREAATADGARAREALGLLADMLLAEGDTAAARDALNQATAGGWNATLFRRAADLQLRLADTARAVPLLAKVVSDPATTSRTADSLAAIGRRAAGAARWQLLTSEARRAMVEFQLAGAVREQLDERLQLARADGGRTMLGEIGRGRVVVLAFWSRFCAPSRQQMPQIDSLAAHLTRHGAVLIPVTEESPSAATAAYLKQQRVRTPSYYDVTGAATRALNRFATPTYYVIDQDGQLRFKRSTLDEVLAEVVALTAAR